MHPTRPTPRITWPTPRSVYRSMGVGPGPERIGAGIMDKSHVSFDHRDYRAPTYSLVYVLRGSGWYEDDQGRRTALQPGSGFQRLPGVRHTTELDPDSGWLEAFVDIGPALCQGLSAMRVIRREPCAWSWGLTAERMARFVSLCDALERASEQQLPALCLRALELVVEALPNPFEPRDAQGDLYERACRALSDDATERLGLRAWCRDNSLDYTRFRKEFRRRYGISPGQYRIRRRMDLACELLQTTERPIAEIAAELGYASSYEFSGQFRRRLGMPPSHYRAQGRERARAG